MDHTAEISREGSEVITIPSLPDFQPICRSHDIEELPFHHSFPQFRRLSMELRLMIWELTWPPPRMIEACSYEDVDDEDEYRDYTILRLAGRFSTLLRSDFACRIVEERAVEKCPPPVALYVCQESRNLTLLNYRVMEHSGLNCVNFYYRPGYDVMLFYLDFADDVEKLEELREEYGEQLDTITEALVEEGEWEDRTAAAYTAEVLCIMDGLETIFLVNGEMGGEPRDRLRRSTVVGKVLEPTELVKRANIYKKEYSRLLRRKAGIAKNIQYMDRSGKFY